MERMPANSDLKNMMNNRVGTLYHYDSYTFSHSLRVAAIAGQIAESMSWRTDFVKRVCAAAMLHDIGKTRVPKRILNKPDPLTDRELRMMQSHTLLGYFSLSRFPVFDNIKDIVLCHHERYDGMGYPFGLKKNRISLESRIIMVADAFDAITSHRVYQRAVSSDYAVQEINHNVYSMFDPQVVDHFNRVISGLSDIRQAYSRNVE